MLAQLRSATTRQAVGTDKSGNLYYRLPNKDGSERRWVEYKDTSADPTTLPVEWTSWLSGTRRDAPTAQEMMELEQKRKLVKFKAALLQKEEEKRKFRAKSLQGGLNSDDVSPDTMGLYVQKVATANSDASPEEPSPQEPSSMLASKGPQETSTHEPETWQPGVWQPGSPKQQDR